MVCCKKVNTRLNLYNYIGEFFGWLHQLRVVYFLGANLLILIKLLVSFNLINNIGEQMLFVKDYETCLLKIFSAGEN